MFIGDEITSANQSKQNDANIKHLNFGDIKSHQNLFTHTNKLLNNKSDLQNLKTQTKFLAPSPLLIAKLPPPGLVKDLNVFSVSDNTTDATAYSQKLNYFNKSFKLPIGIVSNNSFNFENKANVISKKLINNRYQTSESNLFQDNKTQPVQPLSKLQTVKSSNLSEINKQKSIHQIRPSKQVFDEQPPVFFNLPHSNAYNHNGNKTTTSSTTLSTSISSNLPKKSAPSLNHYKSTSKFIPPSSITPPIEHINNYFTSLTQSTSSGGSSENASRQHSSINWINNKPFVSKNESSFKNNKKHLNIFDVLISNNNQDERNPIVAIIPDPDLILDYLL